MKKIYTLVFSLIIAFGASAQTSTEFWFAPPEVTSGHGAAASQGLRLVFANTTAIPVTVTIEQPANTAVFNGGAPIVIIIPANSGYIEDMTPHRADLETMPQDVVLNTGLHITSTGNITCYYEVTTTNNPDIFALKGLNGVGTEFYTPFQNTWRNGNYTPAAYTSFDIVATVDNTTVLIYPRVPLDGGHPALSSYSITLMEGQTYSGAVTSTVGSDNPAGTAIVSDKPIAVSIKDDSVWPQPAGCKDLNGDQLVPVDIVGNDYIATRGGLTVPEYIYLVSTENGNVVMVDGVVVATLFVGETYRIQMTNPTSFISCSQPTYCYHVSGYGCESGGALLPPLNCAGSSQVNVVRSTAEPFSLNIVIPTGAEGSFQLNGNPALIPAAAFAAVPNSGGAWMFAQITFNTTDIPVGVNNLITNSSDVFSVGLINGGASSGTRFGYFSEFNGKIDISAGGNQVVCANDSVTLVGTVGGATTTGQWSTSGTGFFLPDDITLNATYVPSVGDLGGTVNITLTSTGACTPELDVATITFTPAPVVDAGLDVIACKNNADITLSGSVTGGATTGVWTGGAGTFTPNATVMNAVYSPTVAELTAGSVTLTLESTFEGNCNKETDDVVITFTPTPTVDAGINQSICSNNATVSLNGSIIIATSATWSSSGGGNSFSPNVNALNATYTPTPAEIASGSIWLKLTTNPTGAPGICNSEIDSIEITFTPTPTVNAGIPQTICGNNATITLAGAVTEAASATWTNGAGIYSPDANTLNATYTPSAAEITAGIATLYLTSDAHLNCISVKDTVVFTITPSPVVDAGLPATACKNNPDITLLGSVTGGATTGVWIGSGTFSPNTTTLNAVYTPTAAEIAAGTATVTLQSTFEGNCNTETDNVVLTYTTSPTVNAGIDQSICSNNTDVLLNGTITVASGAIWSGGTGSFSNANSLTATYFPSAGDIAAGFVWLKLTTIPTVTPVACIAEMDSMKVTFTPTPTVNAGIPQTICGNNATITLAGAVTEAASATWTNGAGIYSPDANTLNATYTPSAAEITAGIATLYLTSDAHLNCISVKDTVVFTITPSPVVDAGLPATACKNNPDITLLGSVTGGATTGVWIGSGTFSPNTTTLNAVYTPTAAEIAAGTATVTLQSTFEGNCNTETDNVVLTYTTSPTVNAGIDQSICSNNTDVLLNGTITVASGAIWSGGTGSFSNANSLTATYFPSAGDIAAGFVWLKLTTIPTVTPVACIAEMDSVKISFTPAPVVNAGPSQTACGNNANLLLAGSVTVAAGGTWTNGSGVYSPDANTLNATYTPSAAEVAVGVVTLYLTSDTYLNCLAEKDTVVFTITPAPIVDAGLDLTSCANNSSVLLSGNISQGTTTGNWTNGNGTYNPNSSDLGATYTPSSAEILAGTVTLTLVSTNNGSCNAETDDITITIDPVPTVDAGVDLTICVDNLNVNLAGSISGITNTGSWSTNGGGTFVPNNTALNATYIANSADSITGSVVLTLTSTNNGSCLAITDDITITILPEGVADAGLDQTVCANNSNVLLSGIVSGGAVTGTWSSTGTGAFTPNDSTLNAVYLPSAFDIANGTVTLTLTANSCNLATSQMDIIITPEPVVDAGTDQTICASNLLIPLTGSVTGASTTGVWTTLGSGAFDNTTSMTPIYTASVGDSIAQGVDLILTATSIGNCSPVSDTIHINIFPTGSVVAGVDQTLCANNGDVLLNGVISGGASTGIWTTSGSGIFTPSNTTLNATYIPSSSDTANGIVNLILTATNSCNVAADFVIVTYTPAPVAVAGNDTVICGTNPNFNLNGSAIGAGGAMWSTSGSGTFNPSVSNLNAVYIPSAADITLGSVILTLTTTGNGTCNPESDSFTLTYTSGVSVDAGLDQLVCSTSGFTSLQGSITNGASTGFWATLGTGIFIPDSANLVADYQYSAGDISAGSVILVLTSTNNGTCIVGTDTMIITFGSSVFVNAGADQIVCASNMDVSLNGFVSGGSITGDWFSSGSGTFSPTNSSLIPVYTPSATDSINGSVDLILVSTNNGGCSAGRDTLTVTIEDIPTVNAGTDIVVCSGTDSISLSGGASTFQGVWATTGTGSFAPNDTTLNAVYVPSLSDLTQGSWQLILTSSGSQACSFTRDTINVNVSVTLLAGFTFTETCIGVPMSFTDTTTVIQGSIASWFWDFDNGNTSTSQNPFNTFNTVGPFDVKLVVTSSLGCKDSIINSVLINLPPTASFTYDGILNIDEPIQFTDASSGSVITWDWNFDDNNSSPNQNPIHTYTIDGSFDVELIVYDQFGCSDTATSSLIINDEVVFVPVTPTAFSPNNDGENDILFVRGGPFKELYWAVYNQWGNLVFETKKTDEGWDGSWKGKVQPNADYIVLIKAVTVSDESFNISNSVSLIR